MVAGGWCCCWWRPGLRCTRPGLALAHGSQRPLHLSPPGAQYCSALPSTGAMGVFRPCPLTGGPLDLGISLAAVTLAVIPLERSSAPCWGYFGVSPTPRSNAARRIFSHFSLEFRHCCWSPPFGSGVGISVRSSRLQQLPMRTCALARSPSSRSTRNLKYVDAARRSTPPLSGSCSASILLHTLAPGGCLPPRTMQCSRSSSRRARFPRAGLPSAHPNGAHIATTRTKDITQRVWMDLVRSRLPDRGALSLAFYLIGDGLEPPEGLADCRGRLGNSRDTLSIGHSSASTAWVYAVNHVSVGASPPWETSRAFSRDGSENPLPGRAMIVLSISPKGQLIRVMGSGSPTCSACLPAGSRVRGRTSLWGSTNPTRATLTTPLIPHASMQVAGARGASGAAANGSPPGGPRMSRATSRSSACPGHRRADRAHDICTA